METVILPAVTTRQLSKQISRDGMPCKADTKRFLMHELAIIPISRCPHSLCWNVIHSIQPSVTIMIYLFPFRHILILSLTSQQVAKHLPVIICPICGHTDSNKMHSKTTQCNQWWRLTSTGRTVKKRDVGQAPAACFGEGCLKQKLLSFVTERSAYLEFTNDSMIKFISKYCWLHTD